MTVLLLDDRWPTLIPLEVQGRLQGPVTYTGEVPVSVRWNFDDLIDGDDVTGRGLLVTTDPDDPEVVRRVSRGERIIEAASRRDAVGEAQKVMEKSLRLGEWEQSQTHESLLAYLEEEAAEFVEAVRGGDDELIVKELGDVFLQVLIHSEIASRRGAFDLQAVAQSFVDKMRSRSPYLFDGTTRTVPIEEQNRLWAEGKKRDG